MKTLETTWTGIRPLIMHSAAMVDPLNPYVRAIKAINAKGSKKLTDADREEMQRLEWSASMYWNDELGMYIPSSNIERCLRDGAQKSRIGKQMEAAAFVSEASVPITGIKYPKSKEALYAKPEFQFREAVRIPPKTGARVMKVRPVVPTGWKLSFTVEYDETVLNGKDIITAMNDAGTLCGLGDWRPRYGRFLLE